MDVILLIALIILIAVSAFFSGSETSMMSLNRYRLRHLAKQHHKRAKQAQALLKRPDRLLGVILIGNTFANIVASALATILAQHYFGDLGVAIVTIVLTLVILLGAEIMPKTVAAVHPEGFAFKVVPGLNLCKKALYPLMWILNVIANSLLGLLGVKVASKKLDTLSKEELRSVVSEATSDIAQRRRHMLLSVLDLERTTVEDVMVPKQKIVGLNLTLTWPTLLKRLQHSSYSHIPVYRDTIDNIIGIVHLKELVQLLDAKTLNKQAFERYIRQAYFVPESTSLQKQLVEFQQNAQEMALVVDEYGELQGLATVEDVLEEIVGEFTSVEQPSANEQTRKHADGSYIVEGEMTVRDINRDLGLHLPIDNAKTLSGLIVEHLQTMPTAKTCVQISGQKMEILQVKGKAAQRIKLLQHP